jgi:hypothetical protein
VGLFVFFGIVLLSLHSSIKLGPTTGQGHGMATPTFGAFESLVQVSELKNQIRPHTRAPKGAKEVKSQQETIRNARVICRDSTV